MSRSILCSGKLLDLSSPVVMGVLNITPDSFSDGGDLYQHNSPRIDMIVERARSMIVSGGAILDVGGESTRPGAKPLSVQQELDRVIPVVESLSQSFDTIISVDTSTPEVMLAAAAAGAHMINDVRALTREGAMDAALCCKLPVCLMHMQGQPGNMQDNPHYDDVVKDVREFLANRVDACLAHGFRRNQLMVDPGFGFGKNTNHNLELLERLVEICNLDLPVVVGLSRKRSIGEITGREAGQRDAGQRLYGSLAAAVIAVMNGASIVRSHDVEATVDAIRVVSATKAIAKGA